MRDVASRIEPCDAPGAGSGRGGVEGNGSCPAGAVVEASRAAEPEFDAGGNEVVSAPVWWARDGGVVALGEDLVRGEVEFLEDVRNAREEFLTAGEGLTLVAHPGAEAALPWACVEVLVGGLGRGLDDWALDADLLLGVVEVEVDARVWVSLEGGGFVAGVVGEEGDAALGDVDAATEEDAGRGRAVGIDGGDAHGVRVGRVAVAFGGVEPGLEEGEGVGGERGGEGMVGAEAFEEGFGNGCGIGQVHGLVLGESVCPRGKEVEKEEAQARRLCHEGV